MFFDLILFPVFLCALIVLGTGALNLGRLVGLPRQTPYPIYFQLTAALLFLGCLTVLFNFFTGVATPLYGLVVLGVMVWGLAHIKKTDLSPLSLLLLLGVILSPVTANMDGGVDVGLYHLPHQAWLRGEKIVFGLANLHSRFGFGSFMEYIGASLWVGEQFKLLAYAQSAIIVIFLLFLIDIVRSNTRVAPFGVLVVLGLLIYSYYFDISYAATDTPTGVFFVVSFLLGLKLLLDEGKVEAKTLNSFFLTCVLCFMMKASGAIIFLWAACVSVLLLRNGRLDRSLFLKASILPTIIVFVWTIRSVIVSGCLLYPITASCLDVPWVALSSVKENAAAVTAWARHPRTGLYSLDSWAWFPSWWLPNNLSFCLRIGFVMTVVAAVYLFLFKRTRQQDDLIRSAALLFILMALALWFLKAPTPRFGIGIFILLPALMALGIGGFRTYDPPPWIKVKKPLAAVGFALILLLGMKFGGQAAARNLIHGNVGFNMLTVPVAQTVSNHYFGVKPNNGNCWLVTDCTPDIRPHGPMLEKYGYKYFHD